jgi:N-hydroxyarylamine O-acetyltransferase
MNAHAYLSRLAYAGPTTPDAHTLAALHLAHLRAIPFENLDIHQQRPIRLDPESLYDKIVRQRRGGFCYELNGLFAWLLRELGFTVTLLSARVYNGAGDLGPEFDHLTLLVQLEEPWLADVGFGDSFLEPLRLQAGEEQAQANGRYRLTPLDDDNWLLAREQSGQDWAPQYRFSTQPRQLAVFAEMCRYHQTSPDSHFTRQRLCTRATAEGRITLTDVRLIITSNGHRQETAVVDTATFTTLLTRHFAIRLSNQAHTDTAVLFYCMGLSFATPENNRCPHQ